MRSWQTSNQSSPGHCFAQTCIFLFHIFLVDLMRTLTPSTLISSLAQSDRRLWRSSWFLAGPVHACALEQSAQIPHRAPPFPSSGTCKSVLKLLANPAATHVTFTQHLLGRLKSMSLLLLHIQIHCIDASSCAGG